MVVFTLIVLILFSAFFSGSETAFVSIDKLRRKKIETLSTGAAHKTISLLSNTHKLIITILIGNMIVNIFASSIVSNYLYRYYGEFGLVVSIVGMTFLLLIFGEVAPKMLAYKAAVQYSLKASFILVVFQKVFTPFRVVLERVTSSIVRSVGIKINSRSDTEVTEHDIRHLFRIGKKKGIVKDKETVMVDNVLRFKELNAADIMTPRIDVVALDLTEDKDKISGKMKEGLVSRCPVYMHNLDNIVGIIHVKDFLIETEKPIKEFVKNAYFIPESMKIDDLLNGLQHEKQHIAIVTDEYGVTSGVVTIEDILEEIVGEISDEFDYDPPRIRKLDKKTFEVDGQVHINDINDEIGIGIDTEEVDTIGGYVILKMGKIPQSNDSIEVNGYRITVGDVSKNRITMIKIENTEQDEES